MRTRLFCFLLALVLGGCGFTPQGDMVREFVKARADKAADQTAQNAKDYLCEYARVGSITKLFQNATDRQAYIILCSGLPPLVPLTKYNGISLR